MVYRETSDKQYLRFAEKVTDLYLSRLPDDEWVPSWDFDAPKGKEAPKDASAAAIVASALLELTKLEDNKEKAATYKAAAVSTLQELSGSRYQSRWSNPAFLQHATAHWPGKSEIDASIIYADYYYIEALIRYKKWFHPY
jgi:unsaturated chondroitin disaccharide hydrolase